MTSLRDRYRALQIIVADLRQDLQAGLVTDFSPEETQRLLQRFEQKMADVKAAYLENPGGES
jgi:hypothetical protein